MAPDAAPFETALFATFLLVALGLVALNARHGHPFVALGNALVTFVLAWLLFERLVD